MVAVNAAQQSRHDHKVNFIKIAAAIMVYPEPELLDSLGVCSVAKILLIIYELPMAFPTTVAW
jgi:hypothetical protein